MPSNFIGIRSQYQDGATAGLLALQRNAKAASGSIASGFSATTGPLTAVEKRLGGVGTALNHAKGQIGGVVSSLGFMGGAAGLLGVAAGLDKAIGGAARFGESMELLKTQTGATQAEVDSMSSAVLDLAKTSEIGPDALAAGLYHIESAGLRGAKALEILKVASLGAAVGGADLESVTNALIAANQSGVKGVQDMAGAMGTLNAIVGSGNMRMQDLTDAMGTGVLSTAKNYGISIQSVGAALASMTDQGIPAIDAATRLNSAMRLMAAPTSKAVKELKTIGLSQYELASDMRGPGGMLAAIVDLKDHLDKSGLSAVKQAALIAGAFGGKQSGAILTLIGNVDLLRKKQDAVNAGAAGFGDAVASASQQAEYKFGVFKSTLDATLIKVGNVLLPDVTSALGTLGDWIGSHDTQIVDVVKNAAAIVKTVGGGVVDFLGKAVGFWNGLPGPLRDVLLTGFVADRTFKWLFGVDPTKVVINAAVSGIENALGAGVGKGLVQAGLGKLFVQPVFVTNPGFGGGLPGAGAAAGGAGGVTSVAEAAAGFLAPGLGTAFAMALAPLIMFDLIPMLTAGKQAPTPTTTTTPVGTIDWTSQSGKQLLQGNPNLQNLLAQSNTVVRPVPNTANFREDRVLINTIEKMPVHIGKAVDDAAVKIPDTVTKGFAGANAREDRLDRDTIVRWDRFIHVADQTQSHTGKMADDLGGTRTALATIANKNFAPKVSVLVKQDERFYVSGAGVKAVTASFIGKMTNANLLARGGRYEKGKPRLVGEEGPELEIPDTSGTIVPHGLTAALMRRRGGSGGFATPASPAPVININVSTPLMTPGSVEALVRQIGPYLVRYQQRQGQLPRGGAFG